MLDGRVSAGAVVSLTVTVKVAVPVLLAASVADTVTVVVPSEKVVPLFCEYVRLVTPTASVAVAAG